MSGNTYKLYKEIANIFTYISNEGKAKGEKIKKQKEQNKEVKEERERKNKKGRRRKV